MTIMKFEWFRFTQPDLPKCLKFWNLSPRSSFIGSTERKADIRHGGPPRAREQLVQSVARAAYDASFRIDFRAHLTENGINYGFGNFFVSENRDFVRVVRKVCIDFFWKIHSKDGLQ
jgi:hypothetical protein